MPPEEADVVEGEDDVVPELDDEVDGEGTGDEAEGEGGTEDEGGEGEGGDAAPAADEGAKPSRQTLRVQNALKERDTERAEKERYRLELEELKRNAARPVQEDPAIEKARVDAMDPVDRVAYLADKQIKVLQAQIQGLGFQTQDGTDRASYEAKASVNPLYEKYKPEVEKRLQSMRSNGVNSTREAILTYLIGEDAMKRAAAKPDGQRRSNAARRVERANGKPANARSDAAGSRSDKSLEDRLRGVQI